LKLAPPRAFTLGVKAELEKNLFNLPKVNFKKLNFMALYWAQGWKKDTIQLGEANLQPLGPMFQHLLAPWALTTGKKCSKLAPSFFGPHS